MPVMLDAIYVSNLQGTHADIYAGYDDGNWPDADAIAAMFPGKPVVRITVRSSDNEGDVLDCENGDASPADCPGWVARRRAAGHTWPTVYCSVSMWATVQHAFIAQNVPQPYWWIAAYPGIGPVLYPGSVAHQWIDRGPYDESIVAPGWPPGPTPPPPSKGVPPSMFASDPTTGGFWATDANGDVYAENGAPYINGLNTHPEWHAGSAESGNANPCVGLTTFKDKNGQIGLVFVTQPTGGTGGPVPYEFYRMARNGQPD